MFYFESAELGFGEKGSGTAKAWTHQDDLNEGERERSFTRSVWTEITVWPDWANFEISWRLSVAQKLHIKFNGYWIYFEKHHFNMKIAWATFGPNFGKYLGNFVLRNLVTLTEKKRGGWVSLRTGERGEKLKPEKEGVDTTLRVPRRPGRARARAGAQIQLPHWEGVGPARLGEAAVVLAPFSPQLFGVEGFVSK